MSHCLRRWIASIAAVAGIMAWAGATPARADLEIWLSTTDNPPTAADMVASGTNSASYTNTNFNLTGLNITTLSSAGNSPGSSAFAFISGSQTFLQNNSGGNLTVYLTLGNTDYTAPTAPPGSINVLSSVSDTVLNPGADGSVAYNSYVNSDNGQNSVTGTSTPSPQSLDLTKPSDSNSQTFSFASLSAPYSLTERFKITLTAGESITFSSSTNLTKGPDIQAIPEPSAMALAGLGALGLIGYGLRRRKALGA